MANFLYARPSDNLAPQATVTVQAGATAVGYGAEYLTDLTDRNIARPALASGSAISFQLDFGAPVTLAGIVLWSNAQPGLDVRFQGNSSASWGSPPLDAAVTIPGAREDGYFVKPWRAIAATYRYWLLKIPTNGTNPGAKLLCLASLRSLSTNPDWKIKAPDYHGTIQHETDAGARWAYDQELAARGWSATCEWATAADRADLLSWWRDARGPLSPFAVILDPAINDAGIVRFGTSSAPGRVTSGGPVVSSLEPTAKHFSMSSIPLVLDEVCAGGPEWS